MIKINAIGDTCPIPVVKTKKAVASLNGEGVVETLVDNEIAVQNLEKMAKQSGYGFEWEKISDNEYRAIITVGNCQCEIETETADEVISKKVVAISSETMGIGDNELGAILIKGFIFALTQMEELPKTVLFYNGGAKLTCEGSASIEDIKALEALGVEILTCGTCLNHYGIAQKLMVGGVTNMYEITSRLISADSVIKP